MLKDTKFTYLCSKCQFLGYCEKLFCIVVTDDELHNPDFVRAVRCTAFDESIGKTSWLRYLDSLYRDYRGRIVNTDYFEIDLLMEVFDHDDRDRDMTGSWREEEPSTIESWFADFCCTPCPPDVTPRVRKEAKERVRIVATLLKAKYPVRAATWGLKVANENKPPKS